MLLPDGSPLVVQDGVLIERAGEGRVILWLPQARSGDFRPWLRISTAGRGGITVVQGRTCMAATITPTHCWAGGVLGGWLRRLRGPKTERSWSLPDGTEAEQVGPRRDDAILVWTTESSGSIDVLPAHDRWPEAEAIWPVGVGVDLVVGYKVEVDFPEPEQAQRGTTLARAEGTLQAARAAWDAKREAAALADLGLACLWAGDFERSESTLKEALTAARGGGDTVLEIWVMLDLGAVLLERQRPAEAHMVLGEVLARLGGVGDRFAAKLGLDRLAAAEAALRHHDAALHRLKQALGSAQELGDRSHEADLLWRAAIEAATLGRRDEALAAGGAAVALMRVLKRPKAEWYSYHLNQFRSAADGSTLPLANPQGGSTQSVAPAGAAQRGPGLLRMAYTAGASLAQFVGSGFQTASPDLVRSRLATCGGCEHHTGQRCRVCGCFTAAKVRLGHERCPLGHWHS